MHRVLARYMVKAQDEYDASEEAAAPPRRLRVLKDDADLRLAQKLFKEKCNEKDFSELPSFLQDLDDLLVKYGGGDGQGSELPESNNDVDTE